VEARLWEGCKSACAEQQYYKAEQQFGSGGAQGIQAQGERLEFVRPAPSGGTVKQARKARDGYGIAESTVSNKSAQVVPQ
jgi:hypothetical protein